MKATQPRRRKSATAAEPKAKALSLADQAYLTLRRDIISCALKPGAELSEPELAQRLAMSKTPVREALARLVQEGLAEIFPRRGYRVMPVTVKDVNDLFLIRGALEALACELAARRITPTELAAIETLAAAKYTPSEEMSVEAFVQSNNAFHRAIAEAARVPRLAALINSHLEESTRLFHIGAVARDVNPETEDGHARITEALRRGDDAAARSAMIEHTESTRSGLLQALLSDLDSPLLL